MYDKFRELNVPVTLIRTQDETVTPEERVKRILNTYGDSNDVIVISNHINAGGGDGAEVIYALRNTDKLSNLILNSIEDSGQNVRKVYQKRLPSDTSKDYYFIHRETGNTEPVIIEYGFLDSTADDVSQLKNDYKKLTDAVVNAVAEYTGLGVSDKYYTVTSGDSLWSISKKYGVSVTDLKEANNLTTNSLSIGQILLIPSKVPTTSPNTYIVKSGDSLYSIASKFNTTVDTLKSLNNLSTTALSIGQVLKLPSTTVPSDEYTTYTVVSGDSLYTIANKFNTTVDALKSLNNLSSTALSIGQVLKIPKATEPSTDYVTYTVVSGDNLYAIAKKYNTTQDAIMKYNNLSSNLLSIGQILKIPTTNGLTYVVQQGDSLYSIANKFNTTANELKLKNNLTTNVLQIGQILKI